MYVDARVYKREGVAYEVGHILGAVERLLTRELKPANNGGLDVELIIGCFKIIVTETSHAVIVGSVHKLAELIGVKRRFGVGKVNEKHEQLALSLQREGAVDLQSLVWSGRT